MLSNKWTFSLTSLVLILALAFVAPSAMAGEFSVDLSVVTAADNFANPDVSAEDGNHVEYGPNGATGITFIRISTGGVVQTAATVAATQAAARTATTLELLDFEVIAYNHFGGVVTVGGGLDANEVPALTALNAITTADGKSFTMQLSLPSEDTAPDAAESLGAEHITKVLVLIPKHAVELADPQLSLMMLVPERLMVRVPRHPLKFTM